VGVTLGLLIVGAALVVAAVFLLAGPAWALLTIGVLVIVFAVLTHDFGPPPPADGDAPTRIGR